MCYIVVTVVGCFLYIFGSHYCVFPKIFHISQILLRVFFYILCCWMLSWLGSWFHFSFLLFLFSFAVISIWGIWGWLIPSSHDMNRVTSNKQLLQQGIEWIIIVSWVVVDALRDCELYSWLVFQLVVVWRQNWGAKWKMKVVWQRVFFTILSSLLQLKEMEPWLKDQILVCYINIQIFQRMHLVNPSRRWKPIMGKMSILCSNLSWSLNYP